MGIPNHPARRYSIFMFGCALLAMAAATPAFATDELGPDVTVRYHDLDINTPEGAGELLRRIRTAAASVCDPIYKGPLSTKLARDRCIRELTAKAVSQVNRPQLVAAYESSRRKTRAS
ncbi:MAG: UrcA family protein [Pseudomonadota bacterium]